VRLSAFIPKCFRSKIDPRPIDLSMFKPVEKPATFTESEVQYLNRLHMQEERSRLFLEEEG